MDCCNKLLLKSNISSIGLVGGYSDSRIRKIPSKTFQVPSKNKVGEMLMPFVYDLHYIL